jgi:hypothetical protein
MSRRDHKLSVTEVDRGWTGEQTLSEENLPDNIIQSKYLIYIFYPIIIGLNQKTSFESFGRIQRVTNTYVHHGRVTYPSTRGNQLAQVSKLKLVSFSINSCWRG